ncbi:MAG: glutamate--tRNA ligase, partial [Bacteroidetes bacterium]|nr:glutamate--tRNA ligase [Bacteroidota bacterium]
MKDVRVRFAPSPTGYLHIGGLRTALYNYLFARRYGGKLILRIEDTDRTRLVDDAEDDILQCLVWAGISFDEGPGLGGEFGPYRQSERSHIYQDYASRLVETGHAYYAFDTAEEIDEMRKRHASTENQKYDASTRMEMCNSLVLGEDEVAERISSGEPYVIRLHVHPGHMVTFSDLIRVSVSFDSSTIDDH